MSEKNKIVTLKRQSRIWAIASVFGESERLHVLHRSLSELYQPGDVIIYLGNIMGFGSDVKGTINEILLFKKALLSSIDSSPNDLIYLRGAAEEMWCKLLCLHLAPEPDYVLKWMLKHGLSSTIKAYGEDPEKGLEYAQKGAVSLAHWTRNLAETYTLCDGHASYVESLKHAVKTNNNELLFTSSGINPALPLTNQSDNFWWSFAQEFKNDQPYEQFKYVVRGHALNFAQPLFNKHFITLDAGSGRGGKLVAVLFNENAKPEHLIEV